MKASVRALAVVSTLLLAGVLLVGGVWYFSADDIDIDTVPADFSPTPHIDLSAPGVTSLQLEEWANGIAAKLNINPRALMAYGNAEQTMVQTKPQCHLWWTTLAGIAYVETQHGSYEGAQIFPNGGVVPKIRGPRLDGTENTERILDTDGGQWDGDDKFDVAMGPFQFIPETWRYFGVDANGDGIADPDNIDDAAVSAARYLCYDGRDLLRHKDWAEAIYAYNHSQKYVRQVHYAASRYGQGLQPRWANMRFMDVNFK